MRVASHMFELFQNLKLPFLLGSGFRKKVLLVRYFAVILCEFLVIQVT